MKAIVIICFIFIFSSISLTPVNAIWLSPPKISASFSPNMEIESGACVRLDYPGTAILSVEGNLAPYVEFTEEKLVFNSSSEKKCFTYKISLPSTLTPGVNYANIIAGETEKESSGGVGSLARVVHRFEVIIPYPGKYLIASLKATDIEAEKPVEFTVTVESKGNETISKVSADIEIINQNNVSLGSLTTSEITDLKSMETATLKAVWAPSSKDIGTYRAIATVFYDDKFTNAETSFRIGDLILNLINITANPIERGEIGKIDVLVESVWISSIPDVYAEVKAAGKTVKSESRTIESWSKKIIPVYFPTEELEAGEYPATATVYYADKTVEKQFIITIFEDKTMFYFMAGGSIALIILITILLIFFVKQREFKRKMQHAMYLSQ